MIRRSFPRLLASIAWAATCGAQCAHEDVATRSVAPMATVTSSAADIDRRAARDDETTPMPHASSSGPTTAMDPLAAFGAVTTEPRGSVLTMEASTLFERDHASLMASGGERLDAIATALRSTRGVVTVIGHVAGREGQSAREKSIDLARARARAVAERLEAGGVDEARLRVESRGNDRARTGDDDRVEIVLRAPK